MSRSYRSGEVSRTEERQLAVASASLGPWRTAAAVGALGGGVSLGFGAVTGDFGLGVVAGALSLALMLFFLVGGAGAALGGRGGAAADHRIRRWARSHPWQVATVPAALLLVSDFLMRQILTSEGFFGSLWDGLWRGAVVAGLIGLIGAMGGARRRG
ncbi:hypothetical protein AB0I49_37650 [Streptomyces sp. NPDC050617]|uniref:hypothetical protein n=1 Tax=Streptomyces sp. NPDC050617 TaxID=3154628 RepID=UPI0034371B62